MALPCPAGTAARKGKLDGFSSGHTMVIMARALEGMRVKADGSRQRLKRIILGVALASMVLVGILSVVIWQQHKRIGALANEKVAIDAQIQSRPSIQMAEETDEVKLGCPRKRAWKS